MQRAPLAAAVAVVVVSLLAVAPAARFGYVQDDPFAVRDNPVVARGNPIEILESHYWEGCPGPDHSLYRPITILSFALERRVRGGPSPGLSHAVGIALHVAASLVLLAWARRLGAKPLVALAAALLFAAHPIHVSAVANLVGRAEVLATLFSLATLVAISFAGRWRAAEDETPRPAVQRLASWVAGVLAFIALGSKETAFALPALVALQEVLMRPPGSRNQRTARFVERAAALAPFALGLVVYLVLRTLAVEGFPGKQEPLPMDNVLVGLPPRESWATALAMAARYARLLVWPAGLSGDYSGSAISVERGLLALRPLAGLTLIAILAAVVVTGILRRQTPGARLLALAAGAVLAPYLVVGNLLVMSGAGFAERLLYFPSAGVCLVAGLLLGRLAGEEAPGPERGWRRRAAHATLAAAAVVGIIQTRREIRPWSTDAAFLENARSNTPGSVRGPLVLARIAADAGRTDEALRLLDEALLAWPEHGPAWLDRGILLLRQRDLSGAESALRRAATIDPNVAETRAALGTVLTRAGRDAEADLELRRALALDPRRLDAAQELGDLRFRNGRYAEAAHFYRGCVALGWTDVGAKLAEAERLAGGPAGH